MTAEMRQAFEVIGDEVQVDTGGDIFEIDVNRHGDREVYQLTYPLGDVITAEVLDVKPKDRHLVLDVSGWRLPVAGRYLCGHDERHWFAASLPFDRRTATAHGAMEALKSDVVLREQKRKGVKHRRYRRKTAAHVRQGEWLFLPRPLMHVSERAVQSGQLLREGSKPHRTEWLYRPDFRDEMFVRGAVSHTDRETIYLQVSHRVVQNSEAEPTTTASPFTRMAYPD